jgi:hypothetical protein
VKVGLFQTRLREQRLLQVLVAVVTPVTVRLALLYATPPRRVLTGQVPANDDKLWNVTCPRGTAMAVRTLRTPYLNDQRATGLKLQT